LSFRRFRDERRERKPYPSRPPRGKPAERLPPMPLPNGQCNPLCPHFRCLNNALTVSRRIVQGKAQKIAYCRWIGDNCIAGACQYASCNLKALLPNNICLFAKEKTKREVKLEEIEKEIAKEEAELSRVGRIMRRRGFVEEEF